MEFYVSKYNDLRYSSAVNTLYQPLPMNIRKDNPTGFFKQSFLAIATGIICQNWSRLNQMNPSYDANSSSSS